MPIKDNFSKPAPRWFRIGKKLLSNTVNFSCAILLLCGYTSESLLLLVIKLSESFVMDQLDTLMANGEVYAKPDTQSIEITTTTVDTTKNNI